MNEKVINLLEKVDLNKKVENYKLKKHKKILRPYIKMDKNLINFDGTKVENYKFHQHEVLI